MRGLATISSSPTGSPLAMQSGGRSSRTPSSSRPIARARQILPGPPARSPGRGMRVQPRFSRILSSPATGSPAPPRVPALPPPPGARPAGPRERGAADPRLAGDGVQAIVHAVDHVDIGVAAREIEALVAGGPAAGPGMARAIGGSEIGFRLDEAEHQTLAVQLARQIAAQEIPGDGLGGAAVEGGWEGAEAAHARTDGITRAQGTIPFHDFD